MTAETVRTEAQEDPAAKEGVAVTAMVVKVVMAALAVRQGREVTQATSAFRTGLHHQNVLSQVPVKVFGLTYEADVQARRAMEGQGVPVAAVQAIVAHGHTGGMAEVRAVEAEH